MVRVTRTQELDILGFQSTAIRGQRDVGISAQKLRGTGLQRPTLQSNEDPHIHVLTLSKRTLFLSLCH